MAYTSAPTFNSQQLKRVPVQNSQMPGAGLALGTNYINCQPRKYNQWGTDPQHVIEKRPYLYQSSPSGYSSTDVPRGFYVDPSNSFQYYVQADDAKMTSTLIGTLHYSEGYVSICKYLINTTQYIVFLENHSSAAYIHYYDTATTTFTSVALGTGASGDVVFLDGYLFYASELATSTPKQRIYNSTIGAPMTWASGTDYVDAEMFADKIIGLAKHRNMIVAMGESSIEFFYDNANQYGSPLTRNPSYAQQIGNIRPVFSGADWMHQTPNWTSVGDMLFFFGLSREGTLGVYKLENFQITNVTNQFLQRYLNSYEIGQIVANITTGYRAIRLHTVNVRGTPGVMLTVHRNSDDSYKVFVFIVEENVWVEWQWLTSTDHKLYPLFVSTSNHFTWMLCSEYYSAADHYVGYQLLNYEEANVAGEEVTSTIVTDLYDFGTDNRKFFRYADVLGDFGDNTITLSYTKDSNYATYTSMGTVSYGTWKKDTPIRYRNLGASSRLGLKIVVTGPGNMLMEGTELAYNQGQL